MHVKDPVAEFLSAVRARYGSDALGVSGEAVLTETIKARVPELLEQFFVVARVLRTQAEVNAVGQAISTDLNWYASEIERMTHALHNSHREGLPAQ